MSAPYVGLSRDVGLWIWGAGTVSLIGLILGPPLAKITGGGTAALLLGANPRDGSGVLSVRGLRPVAGGDRTRQCRQQRAPKYTASVKGKAAPSAFQADR